MTVTGNIAGSYTGYAGRYEVRVHYEYDQDILNNATVMNVCELQIRSISDSEDGAYSNTGIVTMSYAGYEVNRGNVVYDFSSETDPGPWVTVVSLNGKRIQHTSSGTKIITITAAFWSNDPLIHSIIKAEVSQSLTLQPISRASQFGTLTPFVVENEWSVPVNKYISGVSDTLTISYSTFTKTINNYISGQAIQFSAGELSTLYGLTANMATVPFTLTITSGSYGSNTATLNGSITLAVPTYTATITATPSSAVSGQTNVAVTLSAGATAQKSGTIAEYVVTLGSQTVRANAYTATFSFTNVDGDTITVQAVDSRGWASAPLTQTITLYPYATPTISGSVSRTPTMADTSAALTLSGAYSVVPGQTLTGSYKYRTGGGAWSAAQSITLTYSGGAWSFSATLLDTFSLANAYEFEITVTDLYSSVTLSLTLLSAKPTLDIDTATQRVAIGGFLASEDNQSLSVAGDIYEGGQKLSVKYGSPAITAYSSRQTGDEMSITDMSKSWTVSGSGFVLVSVSCIAPSNNDYGSTAAQINLGSTVMARDLNREEEYTQEQFSANCCVMFAVSNGNTISCTCGTTKGTGGLGLFYAIAFGCTLS